MPDSVVATAPTAPLDTVNAPLPADTASKKRDDLEAPVVYQSKDSMVWYKNGNAYLYGSGQVNYQQIELKANEITIDLETSTVYAQGTTDSLGTVTGRPIFADGDTPYESQTMSYNFKSRKGFINNVTTQQGEGYMTSNTVTTLAANANTMIQVPPRSNKIASAAPNAAPEDAPRISGAAMGFWKTP